MKLSVIVTVYNEGANIERLLDSLTTQTRQPDEVVICDGGSQDDTVARIEQFQRGRASALSNVRIIVEPGANISRGRNVAIAAADGPLIAVTDAGVRLDPHWLAELTRPFKTRGPKDATLIAVAGFFLPDVQGAFQVAMAATVLPLPEDIDPGKFLPSSRSVAFTKTAWQQAGGYPEWLDYCEDLIFDFRMNQLAPEQPTVFRWSPKALVYFKPRTSLASFWTQYYRYARGDGKANLWRKRHALRYLVYLVLFPALVGHGLWGIFGRWIGWLFLLVGGIAYCLRPWQRVGQIGQDLPLLARWQALAWVPVIRAVGDVAKMIGYPVGLIWRHQQRHRAEIQWRAKEGVAHAATDRRS